MIKNIVIVVLAVLCIALVVSRLREPAEEIAGPAAQPAIAPPARVPPAAPPAAPAVRTPLPPPLPPADAVERPPEEETQTQPPPAPRGFDLGSFAEMLDKPEFRQGMVAQQKMMMEQQYGELFEMLELGPRDRDTLKDLLADRMVSDMERGMQAMQAGGQTDPALIQEMMDARQKAQDAIRQFLGEEDFSLFEQYEATQPERMQVDLFKQNLGADEQLTWEQEDELIRALHEERTSFAFSTDMMNPDSPSLPTPDQMQVHMADMRRLNERLVVRASQLLTPSQTARFRENMENMVAMQEMAMGMAQKMFGSDAPDEE